MAKRESFHAVKPANRSPVKCRRWLGLVLFLLFALAMFIEPGPWLRFVNPEPNASGGALLFLGLPVIYAWELFWYEVQAAVVITASVTLWKSDEE